MTERKIPTIEEKRQVVSEWMNKFSETGEVSYVDRQMFSEVLSEIGANFMDEGSKERLNALSTLAEYSNKGKAPGMRVVWGTKFDEYKAWCGKWAEDYKVNTGKKLPAIKQKGKRYETSGMLAFFGEITSYAAGRMEFTLLKTRLEARYNNGVLYEKHQKIDKSDSSPWKRVPMVDVYEKDGKVITKIKNIRLSSFPQNLPTDAWGYLKTQKSS